MKNAYILRSVTFCVKYTPINFFYALLWKIISHEILFLSMASQFYRNKLVIHAFFSNIRVSVTCLLPVDSPCISHQTHCSRRTLLSSSSLRVRTIVYHPSLSLLRPSLQLQKSTSPCLLFHLSSNEDEASDKAVLDS